MKKNNGITLISLVMTIIVMLILVGVSATVALNGGLFITAKQAKEETKGAQVQEQVDIWIAEMKEAMITGKPPRTTNDFVTYLFEQGMLTEDEKDTILGNEDKGIEAQYQITIGSRTIDFLSSEFRTGEAGIYATRTNDLIKSWDELIDEGYITVEDNAITSSSNNLKNNIRGDLVIPEGITEIKVNAFNGYTKLTDVTFPSTLKIIGGQAFQGCTGLKKITILDGIETIDLCAFRGCRGISEIRVKTSSAEIIGNIFENVADEVKIIYEEGVTKIIKIGCPNCTSVSIPSTATEIAVNAFNGYTKLTEFNIPNTIKRIGGQAFQGCTGLKKITILDGIETIDAYAFRGCRGISEIRVKNSSAEIIGNIFENVADEVKIIYEEGVTKIIKIGCPNCTNVSIPSTATEIAVNAFNGYTKLTEFNIPNTIKIIGAQAFMGCTGLTEVNIPSSVTTIGNLTFYNCTSLTKVKIDKEEGTISGSPWGTTADKIEWK